MISVHDASLPPLIVTVVFDDLGGRAAWGCKGKDGRPTIHADRKVLTNDPSARAEALEALIQQTRSDEN